MKGPDLRSWIFSVNTFVAAMLAFAVGLWLALPRPSWAMATVYIVSQPLAGPMRSKAVYRVAGTILGACAAVFLVPRLINAPELLSVAMALWIALCVYLSYLDRTPRSYVFVLAGYTAAIVAFPVVETPGEIFTVALARVEEISLGIVCATLVHAVVFPRSFTPVLHARIDGFMRGAEAWALDALAGGGGEKERVHWRRFASEVSELHAMSTHIPFDTSRQQSTSQIVRALHERMAMLLPILSGVEDRLRGLQSGGRALAPRTSALLGEISAWVRAGPEASLAEAPRLRAACAALVPPGQARADWSSMLTTSLARRLGELVAALRDCRALHNALRDPLRRVPRKLLPLVLARTQRPLHRDHTLALLSTLAAIVCVLGICIFWIATDWADGAAAATIGAVFSSLFATRDDPSPIIARETLANMTGYLLAGVYLFGVLPAVSGFPMLTLVLAPILLPAGALMARPAWVGRATPFAIGLLVTLSLDQTFRPDFAGWANSALAQAVGFTSAELSTRLVRSVRADTVARRLLRTGWRDLAEMSTPGAQPDRTRWAGLMIDRLGLLAPRLAGEVAGEEPEAVDALNDLRIGLNVVDLQHALPVVNTEAREAAERALEGISRYFKTRVADETARPAPGLLDALDQALTELVSAPSIRPVRNGLLALVGLRRGLFPRAPDYRAPERKAFLR